MIIEQTCSLLKQLYRDKLNKLTVADVRIGLYLTAIRLSDDSVGTSATLENEHPFCAKSDRDFGDLTPLKIRGQKVIDILETHKKSGTISSLKTSVLSAISSKIISSGKYRVVDDTDPVQLLDLKPGLKVIIVGAFQSYIRKISKITDQLSVLELDENALAPDQKKYFVPANDYKKIIPGSDVVLITGQTLVNGTIDNLLSALTEGTHVVVTGPSSNILPDILFKNRVSIIGAVRITDPIKLFDVVSEGGAGFHLYEYCARKICILKGDELQTE